MSTKGRRVTKSIIGESVNRALGTIVNELRLAALRQNLKKISREIPADRIFSLATAFISGQFGHEEGAKKIGSVRIDRGRLRSALESAAAKWGVTLQGTVAVFTVTAPKRSR